MSKVWSLKGSIILIAVWAVSTFQDSFYYYEFLSAFESSTEVTSNCRNYVTSESLSDLIWQCWM